MKKPRFPIRILFSVFVLASALPIRADEFVHRFGPATAQSAAFVVGFEPDDEMVDFRGGVRFANDRMKGPMSSHGVKSVFAIRGDGSAELTFRCAKMDTPESGWGSGVQLSAVFNDKAETGLTMAVRAEKNGKKFMVANFTSGAQTKHSVQRWPIDQLTHGSFRMRFERIDDQMVVSFDLGEGMKTMTTKLVSTTDIFPIGVWVGTGGSSTKLNVTLESLKVVGATLPGDTLLPPPPASPWKYVFWISCALVIGFVGIWTFQMIRNP